VTFEEHLENHRNDDGSYDLAAAEADRADELAQSSEEIDRLAAKAAKQERKTWETRNGQQLRKQLAQPALSSDLELDTMVPLGESTAVRYGEMNHERIKLRKDMRTKTHLDELRAFDGEMTHWMQTEQVLDAGETIEQARGRA
jgi:hypothetical protein